MTKQEFDFNKKDIYTYAEVREMMESAMMDRARYLGYFYKVMPRDLFDGYAQKALFAYGEGKAQNKFFEGREKSHPEHGRQIRAGPGLGGYGAPPGGAGLPLPDCQLQRLWTLSRAWPGGRVAEDQHKARLRQLRL